MARELLVRGRLVLRELRFSECECSADGDVARDPRLYFEFGSIDARLASIGHKRERVGVVGEVRNLDVAPVDVVQAGVDDQVTVEPGSLGTYLIVPQGVRLVGPVLGWQWCHI